jgi:heptosyltransferase-1
LRLLIVKMSSIGDVVQALAVLEPLRPLCSHLGWIAEAASLPLLEGHPLIDRLHRFPKERLRQGLKGGLGELARLRAELRAEDYDTVLDLQGLFKSALVVGLSGAGRRVGFAAARELAWLPLTERVPEGRRERHAVLKYLEAARHLGAKIDRVSFPLFVSEEERRKVEALVGEGEGPLVTLSPKTRWVTKDWPAARFVALTGLLVSDGARVVLAGSEADQAQIEAIRKEAASPRVLNLAGRLSLREFAHLCRLSALVISCDSGPMHLAAATGTPVVALFGPTAPWRTGPFGTAHTVVRKGLTCSPCFRKSCASRACMAEITEGEVMGAARLALGAA